MTKFLVSILSILFFISCGNGASKTPDAEMDTLSDTLVTIDSMAYFNKQISMNPTSSMLRYQRGFYELGKGELEKSKIDLEEAIRLDSSNLAAHLLYGNLQLSLTNLKKSKFHYEYILDRDTSNTGAYIGMAKLNSLLDNFANADRYISLALKFDPYLAEAYFVRGIIYRSDYYTTGRESSWDIAMSSFQTTVEQDPDYYSAYIAMGVMQDQEQSDLALEYYNSALDIYPESTEALYNVGMFHQTREQLNEAMAAYQKINKIDSTWADPYYNQGYIHLLYTGELDSSIYFFEKATNLDPTYFQAYNNLGLAYETKGDLENAKKSYQRAIEANPEFKLAKDNLNRLQ